LTTLAQTGQQYLPVPSSADAYQFDLPTTGCNSLAAADTAIACLESCNASVVASTGSNSQYCAYGGTTAKTCNYCSSTDNSLVWSATVNADMATYTPCNKCSNSYSITAKSSPTLIYDQAFNSGATAFVNSFNFASFFTQSVAGLNYCSKTLPLS